MSDQEYTTLRTTPVNDLGKIQPGQIAQFLQRCTPGVRQAIERARWNR